MTKRFADQVAIVAGGARGIGKGVVQRLATEGARVVIFDVLDNEIANTIGECAGLETPVTGQVVDIANEQQVSSAIQQVTDTYGRLDILVNCAGIVGHTSVKIEDYTTEVFDRVMEVNLKGPFLLTKYAVGPMVRQQYGRILHIASIGGKEGNPGMVGYAASKSGLMGLVKGVGKEYAKDGITCNGVAPAVIATPMNADTSQEMMEYMASKIPMGRLGTIEEVTALCCWIVSREASFNTGFVFDVSGGRATF